MVWLARLEVLRVVSPQGWLAAVWPARPALFPRGEQVPEQQVFPRPVSRLGALLAFLRVREAFPQREQAQRVPERQTLPLLVQGLAFQRGSPLALGPLPASLLPVQHRGMKASGTPCPTSGCQRETGFARGA